MSTIEIDRFLDRYPDIYYYIKYDIIRNSSGWYYYIDTKSILHMELMTISIISEYEQKYLTREINNLVDYEFIDGILIEINDLKPYYIEWIEKFKNDIKFPIIWNLINEHSVDYDNSNLE